MKARAGIIALLVTFSVVCVFAADWPSYLGPKRDGTSAEVGLLRAWPRGGRERVRASPALVVVTLQGVSERCRRRRPQRRAAPQPRRWRPAPAHAHLRQWRSEARTRRIVGKPNGDILPPTLVGPGHVHLSMQDASRLDLERGRVDVASNPR